MERRRLIAYPLVGINESTCTPQPTPTTGIGNDPRAAVDNIIIRITGQGVSNYPDLEEIRKGVERRVYKAKPYNQNDRRISNEYDTKPAKSGGREEARKISGIVRNPDTVTSIQLSRDAGDEHSGNSRGLKYSPGFFAAPRIGTGPALDAACHVTRRNTYYAAAPVINWIAAYALFMVPKGVKAL